jgi:hypothetical protein
MRKFALLLAAAVIVSAPMLTTVSTDTFAAAKAKAKSKAPQNDGFWMALGDNLAGKSVAAKKDTKKGGMGGMGGKKAKKGSKKGAKKAGGMGAGGMGGMGGMGGDTKKK